MKSPFPSASPRTAIDWRVVAEHLLRAAYVVLLFLAVLVPSDTPAGRGMFVAQSAGWGLLAMGVSLWLVVRRRPMRWDGVDTLAVGYLLWTAVATFAVWGIGDLRAALNSFFQTTAFVLALLLGRQLLPSDQQRQSVLTAMLSLGSAMAVLGLLQFFVFDPANREQIQAYPELLFEPLGIFDHNSPEARRALDRALSPEPLGTFTLTNSLACFFAPWVIVLVAIFARPRAVAQASHPWRRSSLIAATIALVLLGACLWLTHSRMSILAVLAGLALLATAWLRSKGTRYGAGGLAVAIAMTAVAVAAFVSAGETSAVSAATTSARYRLEYWQSTWRMIRDHGLFGVGPGNFKSVYPHYKLPQASEEIGDPHNFILEVWATAGTPAILLLGALLVVVLWHRGTRDRGLGTGEAEPPEEASPSPFAASDEVKKETAHFASSIPGLWTLGGAFVAFLLVAAVGPLYLPVYLWILASATALWFLALRPLVTDDLLRGALPIAAATMLVNLLAAGGIDFPGVSVPLAVLLAIVSLRAAPVIELALPHALAASGAARFSFPVPAVVALAGSTALYFSCYFLCYLPVMRADTVDVEQRMAADPFSPEVCRQAALSELEFVEHGSPERLAPMEAALDEAIRRDPRSYLSRIWAADARLHAFRALQRRELLQAAVENYAQAVERYPNWSFCHAQLAWVRHLAGDDAGAAAAAREALRLDELCPHEDRKLRRQTLHDAVLTPLRILPLDTAMRRLASPSDAKG